jgi:hypothetical protein
MTAPALTEVMYDSANIYDIPTIAENVSYYPAYDTRGMVRARFPNAQLFAISNQMPANWRVARTGDFETGALTWESAHDFLTHREDHFPDSATGYASYSNLPLLRKGWGVLDFKPWVWVALWPNYPDAAEIEMIYEAVVKIGGRLAAIQYFDDVAANWDRSLKNPEWKHH